MLMKLSVENKVGLHANRLLYANTPFQMFSPQFFKESIGNVSSGISTSWMDL